MKRRSNLKSCLVATGVALALSAGAALAQSGTTKAPESPPSAIPPTSAPPPDTQPVPGAVPPAAPTSAPATQSSSALPPTDRPASANASPAASLATFEDLDLNKDTGLTKDEVIGDQALSNSFATYDTNGDGKLSREEYAKYKTNKNQLGRLKSDEANPDKR